MPKSAESTTVPNTASIGGSNEEPVEVKPGSKFGNWTVIERAPPKQGVSYRSGVLWRCVCSCSGKTLRDVRTYDLVKGRTKSCGCKKKESVQKHYAERALKKRFGRLVVNKILKTDETHGLLVSCRCDCGNKQYRVHMRTLRSGSVKSCGCYALECYEHWRGQKRTNNKKPFKMPPVVKTSALQRRLAGRI